MSQTSRLENFPISWFAVVMGLAGLAIAWTRAETVLNLPFALSGILSIVTSAVFGLIGAIYATKAIRYPGAVLEELKHPVKLNFFATISISLILIGTALLHTAPVASKWIWVAGTILHLIVTLYVLTVWMHHTHFEIQHFNPAWFIPIVGNVLIPLAGIHHASAEISWFFFSIGLVFWLVLMTIFMYRVIFHHPLPARMMPTLFILIAPPAVGCIAWILLTGEVDPFARILYYCGLFLTLLLATQIRRFARLEFFLSWWAYSFPMAAITSATLIMLEGTGLTIFTPIAYVLLTALTILIGGLVLRTGLAIARQEVSVTEG
jgi:tellurite resistance protein